MPFHLRCKAGVSSGLSGFFDFLFDVSVPGSNHGIGSSRAMVSFWTGCLCPRSWTLLCPAGTYLSPLYRCRRRLSLEATFQANAILEKDSLPLVHKAWFNLKGSRNNDSISKDQQTIELMIQFRGLRKDVTRIFMKGIKNQVDRFESVLQTLTSVLPQATLHFSRNFQVSSGPGKLFSGHGIIRKLLITIRFPRHGMSWKSRKPGYLTHSFEFVTMRFDEIGLSTIGLSTLTNHDR